MVDISHYHLDVKPLPFVHIKQIFALYYNQMGNSPGKKKSLKKLTWSINSIGLAIIINGIYNIIS